MPTRIWANDDWEVADDGLASIGTVDYFIARNRLCELRPGRQQEAVASWPLQMADKSWVRIEPFLEAYQKALEHAEAQGARNAQPAPELRDGPRTRVQDGDSTAMTPTT